mmetsp:Transcript_28853/g.47275  ORF Transcript_28853/g.47275 Transcript_28853/m.47275 type:complete len:123 (-) Transcript_28853:1651-2019(-)
MILNNYNRQCHYLMPVAAAALEKSATTASVALKMYRAFELARYLEVEVAEEAHRASWADPEVQIDEVVVHHSMAVAADTAAVDIAADTADVDIAADTVVAAAVGMYLVGKKEGAQICGNTRH